MDHRVHGILQARILKWVAFPFSRGSSRPGDWTQVSPIAGRFFTSWATRSPRILECVVSAFSRGSSQPRNLAGVSCIAGGFFINWAIRGANPRLSLLTSPTLSGGVSFEAWLCLGFRYIYSPQLGGAGGKEPACSAGDTRDAGPIPGSTRSSAEGDDNPLQYSCLENPMDRGAWWATVHGVAKSQTWLKRLTMHTWIDDFMGLSTSRFCIPAAKSLQSCPTLFDSIDGSPPGSSIHGIFQARVLEWGAIAFSVCIPRASLLLLLLFFKTVVKKTHTHKFYPFKLKSRGLPWNSGGWDLPSNSGSVGSIPRFEAKIPQDSWPQNQNIKLKQYCKKFNKGLKKKKT